MTAYSTAAAQIEETLRLHAAEALALAAGLSRLRGLSPDPGLESAIAEASAALGGVTPALDRLASAMERAGHHAAPADGSVQTAREQGRLETMELLEQMKTKGSR